MIAPAFWGQFGDGVTPGQIVSAMKMLGFHSVEEVAVGADLCAIEEAEEFMAPCTADAALYGYLLLPGVVRDG